MGVVVSYFLDSEQEYKRVMGPMTEEQVEIIITTWKMIQGNIADAGVLILSTYLEKYPHNQDKFEAFRNTPILMLKSTPGFRTHALRIMDVFDQSVGALSKENSLDELHQIWGRMANNHTSRKVTRKACEELRLVILDILTAACSLNETQQGAWVQLLENIYSIVYQIIVV